MAARSPRNYWPPCRRWACRRAWSRPATTSRASSPRKSCSTSSSARRATAIRRTMRAASSNSSARKRAPKLPQLKYAVLGLGDSSYPQVLRDRPLLDARLAEARREAPVPARRMRRRYREAVADRGPRRARRACARSSDKQRRRHGAASTPLRAHRALAVAELTRERPFARRVLANQRIIGARRAADVRHVELVAGRLGLSTSPAMRSASGRAIRPRWSSVLEAATLDGDATVTHDGKHAHAARMAARQARTDAPRAAVPRRARRARTRRCARSLLAPATRMRLRRLTASYQLDRRAARSYPAEWTPEELVAALRPLAPRLYSIASSREAVGDEAHLTVAVVDYRRDRQHCSRAPPRASSRTRGDDTQRAGLHRAQRALPPAGRRRARHHHDRPRHRRRAVPRLRAGAREPRARTGRNWLFFGNRSLYQRLPLPGRMAAGAEAQGRCIGSTSRSRAIRRRRSTCSTACARPARSCTPGCERRAFYVCGDATRMAQDVHAALLDVVPKHGGLDRGRRRRPGWPTHRRRTLSARRVLSLDRPAVAAKSIRHRRRRASRRRAAACAARWSKAWPIRSPARSARTTSSCIKFHGSYQQDDRDLREERRTQKLEPAYSS